MNIELYIERIEQYESGTMGAAERSAFEDELSTNTELRQARDLFLKANDVIEQGIENKLRHQLQGWAGNTNQAPIRSKVVSMNTTWVRMAIAASVALLIGWFGFQWAGNQYSDQGLYASHYEQPDASAFRAAGAVHPLQTGFDAMQTGDLLDAAAFFGSIPADSDRYAEAQYYLGHASLQLKQYDAALAAFTTCSERPESKFREKAEWNLLLVYLATGNSDEVKRRVAQIAGNPDHSYQQKAETLSNELNAVWRRLAK